MFSVEITSSNQKLNIRFEHRMARFYHNGNVTPTGTNEKESKIMSAEGRIIYRVRRATRCNIHLELGKDAKGLPLERELASVWTACHPKEDFTRSKGRKAALAKALSRIKLTSDQRREVWFQYFTSVKDNPLAGQMSYETWLADQGGGKVDQNEMMHATEGEVITEVAEPTEGTTTEVAEPTTETKENAE